MTAIASSIGNALHVDRDQIRAFIENMFAHADAGTFASLRSFWDDADGVAHPARGVELGPDLEGLIRAAADYAQTTADLARPAVFCPPTATFSNAGRAREVDLAQGLALSVECDDYPETARRVLEEVIGPATVVVASGGRTADGQDKLHLHWRLTTPTRTPEQHGRLKRARRLAQKLVGADPSNVPAVHPIRWPGSWHRKAAPRLCRIVDVAPEAEVDLDEVLATLETREPPEPDRGRGNGADGEVQEMAELVRLVLTGESYHAPLCALAWRYVASGMDDRDAVRTLRGILETTPPAERDDRWQARLDDVPRAVETARRKQSEAGVPFDLSDDALALEMGKIWEPDARYVALWGRWMLWTGSLWRADEKLVHVTRTRAWLRERADAMVQARPALRRVAKGLRQAGKVADVARLVRSNPELAATTDQWDRDPMLLATPCETIDLRTGTARAPSPGDYLTRSTAVGPVDATAPIWTGFLERVTGGDPELLGYLQRMAGYWLTGSVDEHVLAFLHGLGANGKSTFVNILLWIMGDYGVTIGSEMLMVSQQDRHPTEIARLRGRRLAVAGEIEHGRTWAEAKIKTLTGGDRLQGRYMRQDFFEFEPGFKLVVVGNHKPSLRGVDEAIRRRLHLLPFTVTIPPRDRDPDLPEKLKAEAPAILRWAIEGCLQWQCGGLRPPKCVLAATADYLASEDSFELWRTERCERDGNAWESAHALWESWRSWASGAGEFVGTQKAFSQRLVDHGFAKRDRNQARGYSGWKVVLPSEKFADAMAAAGNSRRRGGLDR